MKFIALLRGINVGGNNKVSMADLKDCFIKAGFLNVSTYINSGNVIFESNITDVNELIIKCESLIEDKFGFHVVCAIISANHLEYMIDKVPVWWGVGDEFKHNAIFVINPKKATDIADSVGDVKLEYESVEVRDQIIFWSAPIKTFSRTRYSKIVGTDLYKFITIRNFNTTKKLAELSK